MCCRGICAVRMGMCGTVYGEHLCHASVLPWCRSGEGYQALPSEQQHPDAPVVEDGGDHGQDPALPPDYCPPSAVDVHLEEAPRSPPSLSQMMAKVRPRGCCPCCPCCCAPGVAELRTSALSGGAVARRSSVYVCVPCHAFCSLCRCDDSQSRCCTTLK
jgi:hypothetical protein